MLAYMAFVRGEVGGGGVGDSGIFNFSDQKRLFHVLFNGYSQVYSLYSLSCKKIFDIC